MRSQTVRLSIGYKYAQEEGSSGWLGLLFAFDFEDPLDINVTWVSNLDHEARAVVQILVALCAPTPRRVAIDEEGEYVVIVPKRSKGGLLSLTFDTSDRREIRPKFTVLTRRSSFIREAQRAISRFCDHDFNHDDADPNKPTGLELLALAQGIGNREVRAGWTLEGK